MKISRLNPTVNGQLHVGHIYNALVTQEECDVLVLRFDDNHPYWTSRLSREQVDELALGQLEDLLWMGISPDRIFHQSGLEDAVRRELARSNRWVNINQYGYPNEPTVISDPPIEGWGPDFAVLVEKVILDHMQGINVTVRGLELLQENALYMYACAMFGYPEPKMIYLPRMMANDGSQLSDISKTAGNWKIRDLRDRGITPAEILDILRRSCLKNVGGTWEANNIKGAPVWALQ